MSDRELEDLFADARHRAAGQIRPPGTGEARRTVRRRRRIGAAATACAVLLTAAGSALLLRAEPPAPAPAAGTVVIADSAPVEAGYTRSHPVYLGNLTLEVACTGAGRLTLVVDGTPAAATGQTAPVEQARATAVCTGAPVTTLFAAGRGLGGLTIRLDDAATAAGRATVSYRITSDTGVPLTPDDPAADPAAALGTAATGVQLWTAPSITVGDRQPSAAGPYRLVVACAGTGTIRVDFQDEAGTVLPGGQTVACGWPPRPAELSGGHDVVWTLSIGFQPAAGGVAPARVAWARS